MIVFLLLFTVIIGFVYTLIIIKVLQKKLYPKWLLSAIFSGITLTCHFINEDYAIYSLLGFVGLLVVSGILFLLGSLIYSIVMSGKKIVISTNPLWKKIWMIAIPAIFIYLLSTHGFVAFLFIAIYLILENILFTNNKKQFSRLQSILPTSKIKSMAMGLVEIEGNVQMIEPIIAPLDNKECIGYKYMVESISRDDDGHKSYTTVNVEQKFNRFYMEDESGKVLVIPDKMEMLWVSVDAQFEQSQERYTQWLLLHDSKMLLIGKASLEKDTPVVVYEDIKGVFTLAPTKAVDSWKENTPLRRSIKVCTLFFAFLTAIILFASIDLESNRVVIKITKEMFLR